MKAISRRHKYTGEIHECQDNSITLKLMKYLIRIVALLLLLGIAGAAQGIPKIAVQSEEYTSHGETLKGYMVLVESF